MTTTLRSSGKTAVAFGASVVVSSLLFEGAVLLIFGEQPKFPRHVVGAPFGVRINEPHASYRHKSADVTVHFRINGQGMRDDGEFRFEKPVGTKRIVVLGDSYTIGYEVAQEQTYASVLERRLRRGGRPVEVLNAGVSGFSSAEEYVYFKRELAKYDPDAVVVGFFGNDLVDNVRTGLFTLEGNRLVTAAGSYTPGGRLGDYLNTSWLFNLLSERSNAFVLLKERATEALKRRIVKDNLKSLERAQAADQEGAASYEARLCTAIFEEFYKSTREMGILLVILSIPTELREPTRLIETFPLAGFDTARQGLRFVSGKALLDPYSDKEALYWRRSHWHWTPLAHRIAGEALAELISREDLLDRGGEAPPHPRARTLSRSRLALPPVHPTKECRRGVATGR